MLILWAHHVPGNTAILLREGHTRANFVGREANISLSKNNFATAQHLHRADEAGLELLLYAM